MGGLDVNHLSLVIVAVVTLVFLEGLLSADNALVMAVMVRHLPRAEQKRVLRYGLWGAFAFRLVAVSLAKYLLALWYLKAAGGLYLMYLAGAHFFARGDGGTGARPVGAGFWKTVVLVEAADIAFSIDSILAAVAMAEGSTHFNDLEKYAIVLTGGVLGIVTMRFVAGYFLLLLERFRGLETGAYGLVAWIGLKLIAGGMHDVKAIPFAMSESAFWLGMLAIVVAGVLYDPPRKPPPSAAAAALVEEVTRMAAGRERDAP